MSQPIQIEESVRRRYSGGAVQREEDLCCPVEYDPSLLEIIPDEVVERDYGCGDPSRHLKPGERVLDLGAGAGKICFIASQIVGPEGRVIGVDMTTEMLELARQAVPKVAERLGYANVEFHRGRIQDLALDLEALEHELAERPVKTADDWLASEQVADRLRRERPLVADESIDVVVSNCVLNLVDPAGKPTLFAEIHRVLARGGRAVISDIVADEPVPEHLQRDPELWSGCISGALTEDGFLDAFATAGFYGMHLLARQEEPWRTVEGLEFRSVTIEAFKGKEGPCLERNQAVIYRGPFREVLDDDGHSMERGRRYAVCDKTFRIFGREPYRSHFEFVEPRVEVPLDEAAAFDCSRTALRHPRETKGEEYDLTTEAGVETCCGPSSDPEGNGCC